MPESPINYFEITYKSISELNLPISILNKKLLPFFRGSDINDEFKSINEIEDFLKQSQTHFYIYLCPYCNNNGLLSTTHPEHPNKCVYCGETEPINKLTMGLDKVQSLLELALAQNEIGDNRISRILFEQCITLLATTIEVFLKDIYCVTSNLEYVKSLKSLFPLFYDESRNDFLNIGKARKRFKESLNIDFQDFLNKEEIENLNLLMLKRNCIVHNLGIIDKTFKEQSGLDVKLTQTLPISSTEIEEDLMIIRKLYEGLYNHLNLKAKENMKENLTKIFSLLPGS